MTPEDVAKATVAAAIEALGADAGGLTVRSGDDPGIAPGARRLRPGRACRRRMEATRDRHDPRPGPEIVRTGRPIFIETRDRAPRAIPDRPEDRRRTPDSAGSPASRWRSARRSSERSSLGFHRDHMVPPEERGLLLSIAHQAAIALEPHPVERGRASRAGDGRTRGGPPPEAPGRQRRRERRQRPRRARRAGPARRPRRGPGRRHLVPPAVGRRPGAPAQGAASGSRRRRARRWRSRWVPGRPAGSRRRAGHSSSAR